MQDNHGYKMFCAVQALISYIWRFADDQKRQLTLYKPQGEAPAPNPTEYQLEDGICLLFSEAFPRGLGTIWGFVPLGVSLLGPWAQYLDELKQEFGLVRLGETHGGLTAYQVTKLEGHDLSSPTFRSPGDLLARTKVLTNWWMFTARFQIDQLTA